MGNNHMATLYVVFNNVSMSDITHETHDAIYEELRRCPDDQIRAERMLTLQILGESLSPDRYENIKRDSSIHDLALLSSTSAAIVNDASDDCNLKTSASYGKIDELLCLENKEILQKWEGSNKRGFRLEFWNNNLPNIQRYDLALQVHKVKDIIQRKYSQADVIYEWLR